MILKSNETVEKNRVKLEVSVEKPEFEDAVEKSYKKNAARFNVQGFRRGRAPRKIIERLYGEGAFYEDAVNIAYPDAYAEAVKEAGIDPVDSPDLELLDVSGDGFTFAATVTVKPEVKLGKYRGLEAEMRKTVVTDEDVERELENRRRRNARLETKEGEAATGDTVVIDFEGFIDGVAFEGGKGENHNLKLGTGSFVPGFEDQLIGKKAGESTDVTVTFPEDYHAELAGKEAVFKVLVHDVKEEILPDLDDEFAKDISEFETLDALREDIRAKLITARENNNKEEFEGKLIDAMLDTMECEVPDCMIEHQLDHVAEDFEYRLRAQGMTLESYLQMSGMDMESFRKTFRPRAERQVKTSLALDEVVKAEALDATDEEIDAEYARLAEEFKTPVEDLKKYMTADKVKEDMLKTRAVELIKADAVQLEMKEEEPVEVKAEDEAEAAPAEESKPE